MAVGTDVRWICPGCGKGNIAQISGNHYPAGSDCDFISNDSLPAGLWLTWNPPCERCGNFRLEEHNETLVEYPIRRIEK